VKTLFTREHYSPATLASETLFTRKHYLGEKERNPIIDSVRQIRYLGKGVNSLYPYPSIYRHLRRFVKDRNALGFCGIYINAIGGFQFDFDFIFGLSNWALILGFQFGFSAQNSNGL
jgi:hypothetical protein